MNPGIYKYFNGQSENPFDEVRENAAHMFWFYESIFEDRFTSGDFSPDTWTAHYAIDVSEWKQVLSAIPVNKEDLFKLWICRLLMETLPDKYQSGPDDRSFLWLYFGK